MDEIAVAPEITTLYNPHRASLRSQIRFSAANEVSLKNLETRYGVQEIWCVDRDRYPAVGDYEDRGECWPSNVSGMLVLEITDVGPASDFKLLCFRHEASVLAHARIAQMCNVEAQLLSQS